LTERTPTEFRNIYNEWKKNAPANDSDVIPDKPKVSASPRHAGLCADLKSMLEWRALYESTDPLRTNYIQDPNDELVDDDDHDHDKTTEGVKRDPERALKDGPSDEAMLKAVEGIAFKTVYDNIICQPGSAYRRERLVPDLDALQNREMISYWHKGKKCERPRVEMGSPYKSVVFGGTIELKSVVRLNHMKISESDQDELRPLGSVISWGWWSNGEKKKKAKQRGGDKYMPPPPVQILNPEELLIAREERIAANDNLAPHDAAVLDAAIVSPNFQTIGGQFGYSGKTAERQGKLLVLAACKSFYELKERLAA
jgi:hypothetical protein